MKKVVWDGAALLKMILNLKFIKDTADLNH
jgi:hypothetical protein